MPQSSPKTPSRSRPTTRDTHGEKTPTPDHGSINGYTHGGKTPKVVPTPKQVTEPPHQFHIFLLYPATLGNGGRSSRHGCHGHTDKGRVERGIERELYFTEPPYQFHMTTGKGRERVRV